MFEFWFVVAAGWHARKRKEEKKIKTSAVVFISCCEFEGAFVLGAVKYRKSRARRQR